MERSPRRTQDQMRNILDEEDTTRHDEDKDVPEGEKPRNQMTSKLRTEDSERQSER